MKIDKRAAVQQLLIALEAELKTTGFWRDISPSTTQLASTEPFCIDTLTFSEWLQFVFLVKMQFLLDNQIALPENMAIAPMAEEAFKTQNQATPALLALLVKLDA